MMLVHGSDYLVTLTDIILGSLPRNDRYLKKIQ